MTPFVGRTTNFDHVAHVQTPTGERAGLCFDDRVRSPDGHAHSISAHPSGLDHGASPIEIGNIEVEAHAEGVHPIARFKHECSVEMVDADETATAGTMIVSNLC